MWLSTFTPLMQPQHPIAVELTETSFGLINISMHLSGHHKPMLMESSADPLNSIEIRHGSVLISRIEGICNLQYV
ncbi:hypothetical protein CEXT_737161 [Caerostris extrusa]|uniref:Uncharacterized protein n=1 Tax=Caerostris extrusa TaxID=172846 RepID=A0AAV4V263_CAEEX|nr:hypothetical protein CEXT_737161 [Caerostris extrusa]